MAETLKVLGQLVPAASTLTTLYTVPAATSTVVSSLTCCNPSGSSTTVRVSIAVAGAADDPKQYLYYDVPVLGHDTLTATLGLTLATTDLVRVLAANGLVAFNLFGAEES